MVAFFAKWKRPQILKAAAAIGVGAVLCGIPRWWAPGSPAGIAEPRYLSFRRSLEAGHPLQFSDLKLLPPRALAQPPAGALTDQDLSILRGATVATAVAEGAIVTFVDLELRGDSVRLGRKVPIGMRAFALPLEASMRLQATDYIDILSAAETLVEGALVLSVQRSEEGGQIWVALGPEEVGAVEKAVQTGKLKVALRNPEDKPSRRTKAHRGKLHPLHKRIEIWSEVHA